MLDNLKDLVIKEPKMNVEDNDTSISLNLNNIRINLKCVDGNSLEEILKEEKVR